MKENFETLKHALEVSKSAGIVALAAVIILWPGAIPFWMERSGVEKLGLFGVEWRNKLKATDEELQELNAARQTLQQQLVASQDLIRKQAALIVSLQGSLETPPRPPSTGLEGGGGGAAAGGRGGRGGSGGAGGGADGQDDAAFEKTQVAQVLTAAKQIEAENAKALADSKRRAAGLQQVLIDNSALLQPMEAPWVIMIGSDPTLRAAEDERKKAAEAGFDNVLLYKNRGRIRTALLYNSRREAANALPTVRSALANDAYMVSLEKFCPKGVGAKLEAAVGVVDCGV